MTANQWITLGTAAGPIGRATRCQPANLLRCATTSVLVDAGDGVVDQLARAGTPFTDIHAVVLSHLHADHVGGLFALLGRRQQPRIGGPLTVYGPPGTAALVDNLIAALGYLTSLQHAQMPQGRPIAPVTAIEVSGGDIFTLDEVKVTATVNTHYAFAPGSADADRFQSLSFRFDTPERAIVYTGDTGPSENVEKLAADADLLISEITDPNRIPATLTAGGPAAAEFLKRHFEREHLSPDAVGELAQRARVAELVLTHVGMADSDFADASARIANHYAGPVTFANDLDSF